MTTTTEAVTPSYLQQPLTPISDLPEPMSLFDELGYIRHRRTNITPFPPVYIPSNRRTSGNVTRFATANALRERLLMDIQHNINEIDYELALLDRRPIMPLYIPISFSSFHGKLPPSHRGNRIRSIEPKRVHKVIPRITKPTKKISSHSTPNQIISPAFIGQYHYAPEMEENEIRENDPENTDRILVAKELPKLNFYKPLTLDEFRRKQSALPENRALIIVPAIAGTDEPEIIKKQVPAITGTDEPEIIKKQIAGTDEPEIIKKQISVIIGTDEPEIIKKTDEFQQTNPIDTHTASSTSIKTSQDFTSTSKFNFRNFEPLIQNSIEPDVPPSKPIDNEVLDTTTNPMISKSVKHTSSLTKIQADIEKPIRPSLPKMFKSFSSSDNDIDENATYLLKDGTNESIKPDAPISVYPEHRPLRTESELKNDDINDNNTNGHSRTPVLEEQNEKESKPSKTKYIITNFYTTPLSLTTSN
jgi:hypothetical protein